MARAEQKDKILKDSVRAIREIIRRAILTFKALPDPDAKFLHQGRSWDIVRNVNEAYGYAEASVKDFEPTPHEIDQAEIIIPWLAWLWEHEGDIAVKRTIGWAMGIPMWRLAQNERVSERTIDNRIDRSVMAIINHCIGADFKLEVVDEPYKSTPFAMRWERATATHDWSKPLHTQEAGPGEFQDDLSSKPRHYLANVTTVYVYGKGLMRNGRMWNDGRRKAERMMQKYA